MISSLGYKAKFMKILKMYTVSNVREKLVERELEENKGQLKEVLM